MVDKNNSTTPYYLLSFLIPATVLLSIFLIITLLPKPQPRIFSIEGNAGSGKTTLMQHLAHALPEVVLVQEPIDEIQNFNGVNLLQILFDDVSRWSLTVTIQFILSHIQRIQKYVMQHPGKILITDRSAFGVYYAFGTRYMNNGTMSPIEKNILDNFFATLLPHMIKPAGFIYLRTDPHTSYCRIAQRGRPEERTMQQDFWYQLHDAYEALFVHNKEAMRTMHHIPVLIIDANIDINQNPDYLAQTTKKIRDFIDDVND